MTTSSQAAKILSQLGASKGGKARAKNLTPERMREIAQLAARTRWRRHRQRQIIQAVAPAAKHAVFERHLLADGTARVALNADGHLIWDLGLLGESLSEPL